MKKSKIVNARGGSVIVSSNLQTAFIFFVFLAQALSSVMYFWNVIFSSNGVSTRAWVEQVLYLLFPLILLGVSYVYTQPHKSGLNRLFIAALKAECAYMFYGVLATVNTQVVIVTMQDNVGGLPPAILTSIWNSIILMSFTFAAFVGVLHFWFYDKKAK